jgi:hypothetical protein
MASVLFGLAIANEIAVQGITIIVSAHGLAFMIGCINTFRFFRHFAFLSAYDLK